MDKTIQLYIDEKKEIKGYPITSPDRVIDENGVSIKEQLDTIVTKEGVPSYSANDAGKVLAVNSDGTSLIFINISSAGLDIRDAEANEIFTVSNAFVYGNIVLSATSLSINEDSTGTFTVSLSTAPTNNQVVNISVDNNNCTVNKSSLTFTPDNYATAQTVTVNTIHNSTNYSDLTSIVTLTSDNATTQKVNVTITNIDVEDRPNTFVSVETINNINYLSLTTEKSSDGTPVDYLSLTEKTSYETELYRYFTIGTNSEMALPLSYYSDFSSYIINGYTKNTNFNIWRTDSNIEESLIIYNKTIYCKVAKTNIESGATMKEIFKYMNNNILQHNNLKIDASNLRVTLTSSEICSYIDSSTTISRSKNGNNVLIKTNSAPFGSSLSSSALLNNYNWYGVPLNETRANNCGFAIAYNADNNKLRISIPIEHFTNDNLELTTENCKTIINNYYSDIEAYSWVSLATS